jgi:ABC-2 type transport system permease protein
LHLKVIWNIALKDWRSASRDGRILLALLLPLSLGLLYNVIIPEKPSATVVITSVDATRLPEMLKTSVGSAATLNFTKVPDAAQVYSQVDSRSADVGLVVPAGFDVALAAGTRPTIQVVQPVAGAAFGVIATLDAALRQMAGQQAPATVVVHSTAPAGTDIASAMAQLGVRNYMVLGILIMLVLMVAMYILPVLLTEEYEKKTADALLMIGSQTDLVVSKALVGLGYVALSTTIFVIATRMSIPNPLLFAAAVVVFAITLVGFGLLLGALCRTVAQLNNWSSIPLLLLLMPVFFASLALPSIVRAILDALPSVQAVRLLIDSLSAKSVYGNWLISFAIMAAWAVVGYGLLIRSLARREA